MSTTLLREIGAYPSDNQSNAKVYFHLPSQGRLARESDRDFGRRGIDAAFNVRATTITRSRKSAD